MLQPMRHPLKQSYSRRLPADQQHRSNLKYHSPPIPADHSIPRLIPCRRQNCLKDGISVENCFLTPSAERTMIIQLPMPAIFQLSINKPTRPLTPTGKPTWSIGCQL